MATAVAESPGPEGGTALLLVPAAVTISLLAVALVLDAAIGLQTRRALLHAAAGSANDAVSLGVDEAQLHRTGSLCLDPDRVATVLATTFAGRPEILVAADLEPAGCADTVVVDLATPAPRPFLGRMSDVAGAPLVRARATASLSER